MDFGLLNNMQTDEFIGLLYAFVMGKNRSLALVGLIGTLIVLICAYRYINSHFLMSDETRSSYLLGFQAGKNYLKQGISINRMAFENGLADGLKKDSEVKEEELATSLEWARREAQRKFLEQEKQRETLVQKELENIQKNPGLQKLLEAQKQRELATPKPGQPVDLRKKPLKDPNTKNRVNPKK